MPSQFSRGVGRPTKLTPQLQRDVIRVICSGGTLVDAAEKVGLDISTLRDWERRGMNEPGSIFEQFSTAVRKASTEVELACVNTIRLAARKDWKAAKALLGMRNPRKYSENARIAVEEFAQGLLEAFKNAFDEENYEHALRTIETELSRGRGTSTT